MTPQLCKSFVTALLLLLLLPSSSSSSSSAAAFAAICNSSTEKMLQAVALRRTSSLLLSTHLQKRRTNSACTNIFSKTAARQSSSSHVLNVATSSEQGETLLDPYEILLNDQQLDKIPLPNKLSPTSLESFTKCPQSFFFQYILKLKPDPPMTPELARGIICHKALEDVFELAPPQRTLDNLQNLFRKEWSEKRGNREQQQGEESTNDTGKDSSSESYDSLFRIDDDHLSTNNATSSNYYDIDAEIEWGKSSLQLLENYYELEDPRNETPLVREMWVNAKFPADTNETDLSEFVVRGKIDRIDALSSNNHQQGSTILRIIDYKTGKKPNFKYSTATNERIANEQFWKMKVYALVLWKMILQSEAMEEQQMQSQQENQKVDYRYGLSWELRQKLLQNMGYESEQHSHKWSKLLSVDSLRLMYLTSHLDDMTANYNTPPEALLGKAKYLDFSLNENESMPFLDFLEQMEQEIISIQRQIKDLVDMQDPKAWHHCNWRYCSCHEMRARFKPSSVSDQIV
jgi:RecB family exonuclease